MANFCEGVDGIDTCRNPRDYFAHLPPGDPATQGHQDCWVGMSTTDDQGIGGVPRGQGCEVGCVSCADLPAELDSSRAPIDGTRWLHPHPTMIAIDATGVKRPLRADKINLIPRFPSHYLAGQCFDNERSECFGNSVCACFGTRSGAKNIGGADEVPTIDRCIPTARDRWYARGFFPAQFLYYGMDFPPRAIGFEGSVAAGLFCRSFKVQNLDGTPKDEDVHVAMEGGEMFSPAYLRDMYREPLPNSQCVVNTMVRAVSAVAPSNCSDAFANAWEFSVPPGTPPVFYNNSATRTRFARIRISGDPHFRDVDNRFEGLSPSDTARIRAKTEAVTTALTREFPTRNGTVRFDQVDHEFRYRPGDTSPLNTWSRSWSAADEGVPAESLPVVASFPIVGRWKNLSATGDLPADLVITGIRSRLWLMPLNVHDSRRVPIRPMIEYHARYRIAIDLATRVNLTGSSSYLRQPWLPDDHPDRETVVNIDYGNRIEPPTISRRDLGLKLVFSAQGVPVDVPTRVEWLGYLGQVSTPTAAETRFSYGGMGMVEATLAGARGLKIPGWPFAHGTTRTDPKTKRDTAQIHGGNLTIQFAA